VHPAAGLTGDRWRLAWDPRASSALGSAVPGANVMAPAFSGASVMNDTTAIEDEGQPEPRSEREAR
jgi:hypothetical protein